MARTISVGAQGFEGIRANDYFYVDKTAFIREWWLSGDVVTLVCRPRRFGKTLNLDTVRCFLSTDLAGRGQELFGRLDEQSKLTTVRALQSIGYDTIATGDSHNDLAMIRASKAGFLFRSTDRIKADNPDLPALEDYDELLAAFVGALG